MKRNKIFLCFAILFGIMFIPFFSGCNKNDDKIMLNAPASVSYQMNIDTGKQMIVTQSNPYASSYIFGVAEVENAKESEYIHFETQENYLDVTNIFLNAKTYYFYAQYVGTDKYSTSKISPISSHKVEYKLDTPYLTINNTTLNWISVENADSYSIYSIIGQVRELVTNTPNTSYNFEDYVNQKIEAGLSDKISFTIFATSTQNYVRSSDSNFVDYSAFLKLSEPTDVKIIESSNNKILSWQAVQHCSSYTIKANLIDFINVSNDECTKNGNKLQYNLTYYFNTNGLGDYKFSVKANNTNKYTESEYSEECTYKNTKKIDTPTNIVITDQNPYVTISWNAVEYADKYELYFSDILNNYQLKQFVINQNGVSGAIVTNSVMLTYDQLGISSFDVVNNSRFLVQVKAIGSGYYTDSNLSTGKTVIYQDNTLKAPKINDNPTLKQITWSKVQGATLYKISIIGPSISLERYRTETYFDYSEFLVEVGDYTITCYSLNNENNISVASNVILKTVEPQFVQLSAPVLNGVKLEDDSIVLNFTPSQNALTYSLYVGNNLINNQITTQNNSVLLNSVIDYKQNSQISFELLANGYNYFTQSEKSNSVYLNTKLQTPQITINGNTLSWHKIENATDYTVILDDKYYALSSIDTNLDLSSLVDINVARQVRLQATNPYLDNSDISDMLYYNRVDSSHSGYTDRYFYYGQTYDYYITSALELFDIIEYTYINFLPEVDIFINFEPSTTIEEKYVSISNSIHGTLHFQPYITNYQSKTGQTTISFDYAKISDEPTYNKQYTNFEHDMVYPFDSSRDVDYQFATDNYLVSQDVYTTDGLLSAIQHHAKPNFKSTKFVAKNQYSVNDVYNRAKQILIEICDDAMTDYEKVLSIHDYIVKNVEYDHQGLDIVDNYNNQLIIQEVKDVKQYWLGYYHYIQSPMFYGFAVCDGYAKMFALLCNMEEIDCIVVNGLADFSDENSGHAWNKVSLDIDNDSVKEWFNVDCTYDHILLKGTQIVLTHQYFLIPDNYFSERYEDVNEFYPYPTTESTEMFYSYYQIDGMPLKVDDPNSLIPQLNKYMNPDLKFSVEFIVKYDENNNSINLSQILSNLKIMFNISSFYRSYVHNNNYLLVYLYR